MRRSSIALAALSTLTLAACGGGAGSMAAPDAPRGGMAYAGEAASVAPGYPAPMAAPPGMAGGGMAKAAAVADSSWGLPAASASPESPRAVATATSPLPVAVQAAGVRAGEWDDNANYRDFLGYIQKAQGLGIERLDVSARRFIVVSDKDGNGVPSCKVTVTDSGSQKTATLTTAASGRAILFPRLYGMGDKLTASTSCLSQSATTVSFDVKDADGTVALKLPSARQDVSKPALDVVFILDTTGSMSEEIESVKTTLKIVLAKLDPSVQIRVGLVEYKDKGDVYVTKTFALTSDIKSLSTSIAGISADGGGDTPEDVDAGLSVAIGQMQWSNKAVGRLAFLIADAPPQLNYDDSVPYGTSAKKAAEKGIKIFTVAASGMDAQGQAVFRQVAQVTGGSEMFVLRGGAGPQSAGGGDPTSSCGGTHENYSSGNLDQLIVSKINLEVTSLKADPTRIPGLNKDENAKGCSDRVLIVAR
jgi:Mg-chelatase subunit ChlD